MSIVRKYERFSMRSRTASEWTALNEVLFEKELGFEFDPDGSPSAPLRFKMGDGDTAWNDLPYFGAGGIPVEDAGAYYTSDDLESVLQEIGAALEAAGGGGTAAYTYTEPLSSFVAAIVNGRGAHNSTTITDPTGNTWTANGTAKIVTTTDAAGELEIAPGANNCISMPIDSGFDVATGAPWSIEFTYRYVGGPDNFARIFQTRDGDIFGGFSLVHSGTTQTLIMSMSSTGSGFDIMSSQVIGSLPNTGVHDVKLTHYVNDYGQHMLLCTISGVVTYEAEHSALATLKPYYNAADTVIVGGNKTGTARSLNARLSKFRFVNGDPVLVKNRVYEERPDFT